MDVGGGSTEIVTASNRDITWLTSIPIGSGALHDRYLPSDPPTHEEIGGARSYLASQLQMIPTPESPSTLIVTGSSASSLLKLAKTAFRLDEQNERLTFEDLALCEGLMCALPSKEISKRYKQRLERARILPAGGLIIQAFMQHLHLNEIRVSSHGVTGRSAPCLYTLWTKLAAGGQQHSIKARSISGGWEYSTYARSTKAAIC